jgi:hypothetical protein
MEQDYTATEITTALSIKSSKRDGQSAAVLPESYKATETNVTQNS